ncbi:S-adenosyl-L-methionine-dependent methyltransferase [Trichoderma citrinoviride]|uniref:S-adenosyl-L-methionine-dependent methyltransferase n=1 Tax=Trichoderma citrinoviride TaxID=58853 RepID=A0A2T4B6L4_9HYPO|nr:S-adenosyl-L-methionine-dependent methyltransferase [Trichoderma citrinoviride]PTB64977.1 S-adenosyl-L-methionine-dependent methyltransferase [Trichoderma citrinoviride]
MEKSKSENADMAATNREFWNTHGTKIFQNQWVLNMAKKIADSLSENVEWLGVRSRSEGSPPVKLLDYACGFGMVSSTLLGHFDIVRGIDISDTSVAGYNEIARKSGVPAEQMVAVQGSIPSTETDTVLAKKEFFDFDLIAISMALHHIDDRVGVLSGLYERLRSGGVLVVIDLTPEADAHGHSQSHGHGHSHNHSHAHSKDHVHDHSAAQHTISKHGSFGPEDMKALMVEAGFVPESFDYKPYLNTTPVLSNIPAQGSCESAKLKPFFIAKGMKQ